MPEQPKNPDPRLSPEQLDLFLDGQLSGDALRGVESLIESDTDAQQVLLTQAKIDAALKTHFRPPTTNQSVWEALAEEAASGPDLAVKESSAEQAAPRANSTASTSPKPSARQKLKFALAIAASLACIALWGSRWEQLSSIWSPRTGGYDRMTVAQVYRTAVDAGFQPDWFCEDEQRFAETFEQRQGQGLLLKPLPDGVRMAGLAYLKGFTPKATCMLAYVDERPVLVLAAKTRRVDRRKLKATSEVAVFRTELGDLTLVEVTPADLTSSDAPRLLPYFYAAAVPDQPTGRVPGSR